MSAKLLIGILAGECPLDAVARAISPSLPGLDFAPCHGLIVQAPSQTLAFEDTDLDLRHIQPARMLGRMVKHHPAQQLASRGRTENLFEARTEVRVEIIRTRCTLRA